MVRLKRAYEPASRTDGYRVLVERLWPRGLRKDDAHLDRWLKDIAPSAELRRWFAHDPGRYAEFRARYRRELAHAEPLLDELARRAKRSTVTLVYAARDQEHNGARVLAQALDRRLKTRAAARTRTRSPAPSRAK